MRFLFLATITVAFILTGCSLLATPTPQWSDPATHLQWPSLPETPRIRFLREFHGPIDFQKKNKTEKFVTWLTGDEGLKLPFVSPYGITADGKGKIWVADAGIHGVHMIDLARKQVRYLFAADQQALASPAGIAADIERKRLYLTDTTLAKVFVFDLDGRYIESWSAPDGFGRPAGLALDLSGNLYVVDALKNRVSLFSPQGEYLRDITSAIPPDFSFHTPSNVAVDAQGRIFVADTMNFRIEVFDHDGKSLGTIGSIGDSPGLFSRPRGVAVDRDGHVYVSDASLNNIQIFDSTGNLLLLFGKNGKKPGTFSLPAGLFIDQENRLYVVDSYNQRLQIFEYLP